MYDLPLDDLFSRVVNAEGQDYLITMDGWHWNSLDWMNDKTNWVLQDFIEMALCTAKELEQNNAMTFPGNFPAEFMTAFKGHVYLRMKILINEENGLHNDNVSFDGKAVTIPETEME